MPRRRASAVDDRARGADRRARGRTDRRERDVPGVGECVPTLYIRM